MGRIWKAAIIIGAIYAYSPVTDGVDAGRTAQAAFAMAKPAVTEGLRQGIATASERGLVPLPSALADPVATAIVAEADRRVREATASPARLPSHTSPETARPVQAYAPLPPRRPAS